MTNNYTNTIVIQKPPQEVYAAINKVADWWIGEIQGQALKVGDEFTYQYKNFHKSRQKVTELIPGRKIVWHVEEATLSFIENKDEWKGTDIVFEITAQNGQTEIKFTHFGLTPKAECFEACSGGWNFYIKQSLVNYLMKGKGIDPGF